MRLLNVSCRLSLEGELSAERDGVRNLQQKVESLEAKISSLNSEIKRLTLLQQVCYCHVPLEM